VDVANAMNRKLPTTLAEAQRPLPQAERATTAPMPAEAALVLVHAMRCMMRRATPEMKIATPTA